MKRVSKNPGINKNQKETLAEIQAWASGNADQPRSMIEKIARLVPTSTQVVPKKSPGIRNIHQEYMGLSTKSHLFMTNAVYTTLLERRIQQVAPPIEDTPTITITEDTKQSLHYVGGYFIRSLTKTNNVKVRDFLQLLTDNKEDSTRHSEWTTLQNRGGYSSRMTFMTFYIAWNWSQQISCRKVCEPEKLQISSHPLLRMTPL